MKALVLGPAFGLDNLRVEERPQPVLKATCVRVAVHAVSLNYRDWMTIQGTYNPKQPLPLVVCSDAAGEVIEVGSAVTRVKVGDRVTGLFAQGWLAGAPTQAKLRTCLGGPIAGVLAEEIVLTEDGAVPFPAHLSYAEAATLPCAAITAWSALEQAGLTSGQTVLVQGTGGVSMFAAQFAVMRGAKVIITSKSDAKLAQVGALISAEHINYTKVPEWGKAARDLTGGEGVDVVVEVGGGGTLAQSIRATKPGGVIALIGVLAGTKTEVQLTSVLMQNIRIQGVIVGHRETYDLMNRAIAISKLRPVVGRIFPFTEVHEALRYMDSAAHFGKIVIAVR